MSAAPEVVDAARRARFEALFREVYVPLQRYARRRVGGGAVDDVVADTLAVVWRRLEDVPLDDLALAWCFGVARRCLANQRRGDERRNRLADRLRREPPGPVTAAVDEAGADEVAVDDPALAAALAALSSDDRELVRLWAWEQLAPREIAVVMGLSANVVSVRLHRARQRLGEALVGKEAAVAGHEGSGHAKEAR